MTRSWPGLAVVTGGGREATRGVGGAARVVDRRTTQRGPEVPVVDGVLEPVDRGAAAADRSGDRAVDRVAGGLGDGGHPRGPAVVGGSRTGRERGGGAGRVGGVRLVERVPVEDQLPVAVGLETVRRHRRVAAAEDRV